MDKNMQRKNKKALGSLGEHLAVKFLSGKGFEVLATNYRVGRMGEIDIIAREKEYICFIEVKTRTDTTYGAPSEAVDRRKQIKIIRLAAIYMSQNKLERYSARFDVVEVLLDHSNGCLKPKSINILRNAFQA